jgi:3-oxoacyl-[acyl-carrier protein] reductase
MSKTLARELAGHRIRVNSLSPGFVATPLHDKVSNPQLISQWISQIPMGRGGEPSDCAGAALFLASSSLSAFVTGQVIEVNGGQYMGG